MTAEGSRKSQTSSRRAPAPVPARLTSSHLQEDAARKGVENALGLLYGDRKGGQALTCTVANRVWPICMRRRGPRADLCDLAGTDQRPATRAAQLPVRRCLAVVLEIR